MPKKKHKKITSYDFWTLYEAIEYSLMRAEECEELPDTVAMQLTDCKEILDAYTAD